MIQHTNSALYRKPTTTDIKINHDSYCPYTQKVAFFHSLIHRLITYPLDDQEFSKELSIIQYLATANGFKNFNMQKIVNKKLIKKSLDLTTVLPRNPRH